MDEWSVVKSRNKIEREKKDSREKESASGNKSSEEVKNRRGFSVNKRHTPQLEGRRNRGRLGAATDHRKAPIVRTAKEKSGDDGAGGVVKELVNSTGGKSRRNVNVAKNKTDMHRPVVLSSGDGMRKAQFSGTIRVATSNSVVATEGQVQTAEAAIKTLGKPRKSKQPSNEIDLSNMLVRKIKSKEMNQSMVESPPTNIARQSHLSNLKAIKSVKKSKAPRPSSSGLWLLNSEATSLAKVPKTTAQKKRTKLSIVKKRVIHDRWMRFYLMKPEALPVPLRLHPAMLNFFQIQNPVDSDKVTDIESEVVEGETVSGDASSVLESPLPDQSSIVSVQRSSDPSDHANKNDTSGVYDHFGKRRESLSSSAQSKSSHLNQSVNISGTENGSCSTNSTLPALDLLKKEDCHIECESTSLNDNVSWDARIFSPVFFGYLDKTEFSDITKLASRFQVGLKTKNLTEKIRPIASSHRVRDYVTQALSSTLDGQVLNLVSQLKFYQDRAKLRNPRKANQTRRLVIGLREVLRGVKSRRCKCIIVAPDIELGPGSHLGEVECKVLNILKLCQPTEDEIRQGKDGIAIIFALSKNRLGKALGKPVALSSIGIYSADGAHEEYDKVLKLSAELSQRWKTAPMPEQVTHHAERMHLSLCSRCNEVLLYLRFTCIKCKMIFCSRCHDSIVSRGLKCSIGLNSDLQSGSKLIRKMERVEDETLRCDFISIHHVLPQAIVEEATEERNCRLEKRRLEKLIRYKPKLSGESLKSKLSASSPEYTPVEIQNAMEAIESKKGFEFSPNADEYVPVYADEDRK